MRINSINNNQKSSITFGYDKELNKKVIKKLSSEPSDLNTNLLELNNLCNKTEDKVEFKTNYEPKEDDGFYSDDTETLIKVFISLKDAFSDAMEKTFPELNYKNTEIKHYMKASKGDDMSWQNSTANALLSKAGLDEDNEGEELDEDADFTAEDEEFLKYADSFEIKTPRVKDLRVALVWRN